MAPLRSHVPSLHSQRGRDGVLHRQVAAHGVRRLVEELNSAQVQPTGVDRERTQRSAREPGFKRSHTTGSRGSARAKDVEGQGVECTGTVKGNLRLVVEVELERIVFAYVR